MHVFCSYSSAVNRQIVPKATTCVFLGYAQSGYRCYDVKSKRLDVSLMLSLMEMESPHLFLNLINKPRGRIYQREQVCMIQQGDQSRCHQRKTFSARRTYLLIPFLFADVSICMRDFFMDWSIFKRGLIGALFNNVDVGSDRINGRR